MPSADRRTDRWTDGQGESSIPPSNFVGRGYNDAFAGILSSSLQWRLNDKALLATIDKYARPENMPNMLVPKTTDVIWDHMRKGAQITDAHQQKIQTCGSKALVPLITIMNAPLLIWHSWSQMHFDLAVPTSAFYHRFARKSSVMTWTTHSSNSVLGNMRSAQSSFSAMTSNSWRKCCDNSMTWHINLAPAEMVTPMSAVEMPTKRSSRANRATSKTNRPRTSHIEKDTNMARTKVKVMRYVFTTICKWLHNCLHAHRPVRWLLRLPVKHAKPNRHQLC